MRHVAREKHSAAHPVHVTLRARADRGSLRTQQAFSALNAAIRGSRRDTFHVTHYSIQRDHVHLIVEASSREELTAGLRRLTIRTAQQLNRRQGVRKGKLWSDRYHRHDLQTPREVRNALVYVLANARKHQSSHPPTGLDPFSSAIWFSGYAHLNEPRLPPPPEAPVEAPRTWLLRVGWQRHGFILSTESPRSSNNASTPP